VRRQVEPCPSPEIDNAAHTGFGDLFFPLSPLKDAAVLSRTPEQGEGRTRFLLSGQNGSSFFRHLPSLLAARVTGDP